MSYGTLRNHPCYYHVIIMHTVNSRYNKLLGPVKLHVLCYIEILLYPGCKNNKIQRNLNFGKRKLLCYIGILLYQCSL